MMKISNRIFFFICILSGLILMVLLPKPAAARQRIDEAYLPPAQQLVPGQTITEGGRYLVGDASGEFFIDTDEEVFIIGKGTDNVEDACHEAYFKCLSENANIILEDLFIDNASCEKNTFDFTGKGNSLESWGINIIMAGSDNPEDTHESAAVHVGKGTALNLKVDDVEVFHYDETYDTVERGILYMYSREAIEASMLGGNYGEANGRITIKNGPFYFLGKGSGTLIGSSGRISENPGKVILDGGIYTYTGGEGMALGGTGMSNIYLKVSYLVSVVDSDAPVAKGKIVNCLCKNTLGEKLYNNEIYSYITPKAVGSDSKWYKEYGISTEGINDNIGFADAEIVNEKGERMNLLKFNEDTYPGNEKKNKRDDLTVVKNGIYYLYTERKRNLDKYYNIEDCPEFLSSFWYDFNKSEYYVYINMDLNSHCDEMIGINGVTYNYNAGTYTEKKVKLKK